STAVLDRFDVEHQIVVLEKTADARLVDLHFESTDSERPERRRTFTIDAVVPGLDAFDARGWNGIEIGGGAQAPSRPGRARYHLNAGGARTEQPVGTVARGRRP